MQSAEVLEEPIVTNMGLLLKLSSNNEETLRVQTCQEGLVGLLWRSHVPFVDGA